MGELPRTRGEQRLPDPDENDATPSFEELYDRYGRSTHAFFVRRTGNPTGAADLNQELYLRLSRSMATFEGRCSWRTWIFVIARAVLADARGKAWSRMADRTVTLDTERFTAELSLDVDADERAAEVLSSDRLQRCIRLLSDAARVVIIGHYFRGVTLRELTEQLDLGNPSGARAILISAQRTLRRCLQTTGAA